MPETQPLAGDVCARHCSICEGMDHHWMHAGDVDEAGDPVMSCKHCDATREPENDDYE